MPVQLTNGTNGNSGRTQINNSNTTSTPSTSKQPTQAIPAAGKTLPASFPTIQPLKAARLFECGSSDLGSWQVYFSSRSIQHFRQLDKSAMLIVVKKIKEISNGHFSPDNMVSCRLFSIPTGRLGSNAIAASENS